MFSVYVPAGVVPSVEMVSALEPLAVIVCGLNVGVAPAGRPVTLNATEPVNPARAPTVTVYPALAPCTTLLEDGVAATEKSDTVMVRVAATLVMPPLSVTRRLA